MNRATTYSAIGLSALALAATVDTAFGFGAAEWLADLCLTDRGEDMSAMDMSGRDVKPVPLIALSLGVTASAIGILGYEQKRITTGRTAPNSEERAGILSAMVLVSAARGRLARDEILSTFQVVTGHRLEDVFADLTMERFNALNGMDPQEMVVPPISSAIGRRRALGAALLAAHPSRGNPRIQSLIANHADQIGASEEDCLAVRQAVEDWTADCRNITEVPLVSLLRHRPLTLRPA